MMQTGSLERTEQSVSIVRGVAEWDSSCCQIFQVHLIAMAGNLTVVTLPMEKQVLSRTIALWVKYNLVW